MFSMSVKNVKDCKKTDIVGFMRMNLNSTKRTELAKLLTNQPSYDMFLFPDKYSCTLCEEIFNYKVNAHMQYMENTS